MTAAPANRSYAQNTEWQNNAQSVVVAVSFWQTANLTNFGTFVGIDT